MLFRLGVGYTPFGGSTFDETVDQILKNELEFPYFIQDQGFIDLVSLLLNKDGSIRLGLSLDDADIITNRQFFVEIDWKDLWDKKISPPHIPVTKDFVSSTAPYLNTLYTSDFIVGDKDGYGSTFLDYNTVNYLKN